MTFATVLPEMQTLGLEMHRLAEELFPLHRSITGDGLRSTLDILARHLPLHVTEVPSGSEVFDWTVPQEWRMADAYIADASGSRIVDYRQSNLHVVNYSRPVRERMSWNQLRPHIHTLAEQGDLIPYRTAYFRDSWGFCVNQSQYQRLADGGPWEVVIDAEFFDGSLTLAECRLAGATDETVLLHCHTCHPSLANDNLSGIVVATQLARYLETRDRRLSYRFVFAPATIGAITWLALQSRSERDQVKHGLVLTLLGDGAPFTYKQSRAESATIDRLVQKVLEESDVPYHIRPFAPTGYDERQYGSPGIDLAVGRLTRSVHGEFPEYHTSADNLDLVRPENLAASLQVCVAVVDALEANVYPLNNHPCGEPQLGRYGIFRAFGEQDDRGRLQEAMMWILNLADGRNDLLAIAQRSGLTFPDLHRAITLLQSHNLVISRNRSCREEFCRMREALTH
jgi:aminopeptidase-like protein